MGKAPRTVDGRAGSVEQPVNTGGTGRMSTKALARPIRQGIELLPRPPATGGGTARRRGSTRDRTGLPGRDRGGWVTRPLGPETTSVSTGSVTGTGQLKGPCDSYSQGPFVHFRPRCRARAVVADPAQLWGSERFLWRTRGGSVDEPANCGGTRRMFPQALAHPPPEGIELLPRPPATGGGTARRRRSTRERTGLPGRDRDGEMTTPPGPEEKSGRSGASSVPVNRRALGTHTPEGPSPFSGLSFSHVGHVLSPHPDQMTFESP